MQTFKITAHYATGHGFRFHANALDVWGRQATDDQKGWAKAYQLTIDLKGNNRPMDVAAVMFEYTNTTNGWCTVADFFGEPQTCLNARSLSVGDVLEITNTATGATTFMGVDSTGFRIV